MRLPVVVVVHSSVIPQRRAIAGRRAGVLIPTVVSLVEFVRSVLRLSVRGRTGYTSRGVYDGFRYSQSTGVVKDA